jgi:hypothetical protein
MAADYEKPQAWSDLSREARRIAYQVRDDGIRGTVLLIAKEYEKIAALVEARRESDD